MTQPSTPGPVGLLAIIEFALTTGVATAVLNQAIGWWREAQHDRASTKRDARYLAIRLAVMLEEFAFKCADRIADNEMHRQSGGHAGKSWGCLPDLPPYPDEDDWRVLAPDLLSRVLTLRNELSLADNAIAFWSEIDRECTPQECDQQVPVAVIDIAAPEDDQAGFQLLFVRNKRHSRLCAGSVQIAALSH